MKCIECHDTGSLSKNVDGHLDCTRCLAAVQRTDLEGWYRSVKNQYNVLDLLWLAFQRGQAETVSE